MIARLFRMAFKPLIWPVGLDLVGLLSRTVILEGAWCVKGVGDQGGVGFAAWQTCRSMRRSQRSRGARPRPRPRILCGAPGAESLCHCATRTGGRAESVVVVALDGRPRSPHNLQHPANWTCRPRRPTGRRGALTFETTLLVAGAIFVFIALVGGGFKAKEIELHQYQGAFGSSSASSGYFCLSRPSQSNCVRASKHRPRLRPPLHSLRLHRFPPRRIPQRQV